MGNWSNVTLLVVGQRTSVLEFARQARPRSSEIFSDFREGETFDLRSDRVRKIGRDLSKKTYDFQVRNDDGCKHFSSVSRRFPKLRFVLSYFHPADGSCGSYLIERGKSKEFLLPAQLWEDLLAKHGYVDSEDDDDEWEYWVASREGMDIAQAWWERWIT